MIFPLHSGRLRPASVALSLAVGIGSALLASPPADAQALFSAQDVDQQRFVLVAAPIGSKGDRYQLNIYEQVNDRRPCYAVGATLPAPVDPLLATFDFTGICSRYIDANGYSLRVGGSDLATSYRLLVRNDSGGTLLVALPTKAGAGPELIVARAGGPITGFHKLQLEPGWLLMRRTYGGRRLGHLYVYNASWPAGDTAGSASTTPSASSPPAQALPPAGGATAPRSVSTGATPAGAGAPPSTAAGPAPMAVPPPVAPPRL
ncbi:MAG: DUF3747 domain-containing protein [Cyanobium sp.]